MDDANRMLSQEEIDTLLTSHFAKNQEHTSKKNAKPSTSVLAPEKPAPLLPQTLNPLDLMSSENNNPQSQTSNPFEDTIEELSERLKKLEKSVENLQKQNGNSSKAVDKHSKSTMDCFDKLNEQVMTISEQLKGTAGYNINKTYTCRQCGSLGIVGIRVRCNQCGKEDWWGWWPKKNK